MKTTVSIIRIRPWLCHIYVLIDPRDGRIRYVGKSTDPARRLRFHLWKARAGIVDPKYAWLRQLIAGRFEPIVNIVETVWNTDDRLWWAAESAWIAWYRARGYDLTNIELGGLGTRNRPRNYVAAAKQSCALKGRPLSEAHKAALSRSRKGMKFSESHRASLRSVRLGKKHRPESIEKMRAREYSAEVRAKLSEAQKRRWQLHKQATAAQTPCQ